MHRRRHRQRRQLDAVAAARMARRELEFEPARRLVRIRPPDGSQHPRSISPGRLAGRAALSHPRQPRGQRQRRASHDVVLRLGREDSDQRRRRAVQPRHDALGGVVQPDRHLRVEHHRQCFAALPDRNLGPRGMALSGRRRNRPNRDAGVHGPGRPERLAARRRQRRPVPRSADHREQRLRRGAARAAAHGCARRRHRGAAGPLYPECRKPRSLRQQTLRRRRVLHLDPRPTASAARRRRRPGSRCLVPLGFLRGHPDGALRPNLHRRRNGRTDRAVERRRAGFSREQDGVDSRLPDLLRQGRRRRRNRRTQQCGFRGRAVHGPGSGVGVRRSQLADRARVERLPGRALDRGRETKP